MTQATPTPINQLLTINEVTQRVTLSPTTIYRLMKNGSFPGQVHLGPNRVAWRESDIATWVADRSVGIERR